MWAYIHSTMKTLDVRSGPIAPALVRLSLPVLAGQAFNLLYNLVDTWFIARIDTADPWLVGATGLVFPLFFILMATSFGITGGVSSLVARAIGAGRSRELDRTAESGIFLAIVASALFLLVMYPLSTPLLSLFGGTDQMLVYGREYLHWLLPVVPFMLLSAVFTGILQGEGRPKHMMVSMMIGTVVNIVLDPLLIFTAGMGIAGAGLATALGNAAGLVYLVIVFLKTTSQVKIHWKISFISLPVVREILRVGLPQSLMNFLSSLSFIFYNRIMIDINPYILTSFTLYSRMEQVALIPIWSLSSGLATIAGQAAGARDIERMRRASRTGSGIGLAVTGTLLLGYVLASPWIFRFFQTDAEVLRLAAIIAPWMAAASFVSVPMFMVNTVMGSSGFANYSLILTALRIYGLNVPACLLGAYVIGRGVTPVMIGIFVSSVLALLLSLGAQHIFLRALERGRLKIAFAAGESDGAVAELAMANTPAEDVSVVVKAGE